MEEAVSEIPKTRETPRFTVDDDEDVIHTLASLPYAPPRLAADPFESVLREPHLEQAAAYTDVKNQQRGTGIAATAPATRWSLSRFWPF